jgi:hypothetical protein
MLVSMAVLLAHGLLAIGPREINIHCDFDHKIADISKISGEPEEAIFLPTVGEIFCDGPFEKLFGKQQTSSAEAFDGWDRAKFTD